MGVHTLFIGHSVISLDRVDSTNNYLHGLLSKKAPAEGFIVRAVEQYAGKGQRGNSWLSQPGVNLTFSLLLEPRFLPLSEQFWLTKALALGVAEFVSAMVPSASVAIKWPNDIYVNDRKIAGILVENILEKSAIKYSIAGIGLNVNQDSFDPSLPNATSLKMLSGKNCDLLMCLENLCVSIEKFYLELRHAEYKRIDARYHKLLYKKDVLHNFLLDGKAVEGTITGVSAQGHLLINAKNGSELIVKDTIEVKDVKHLVFL
jgi:BirA family biotin operon repressor/biotin-[acetyl-CoA-carboxylase] ligase